MHLSPYNIQNILLPLLNTFKETGGIHLSIVGSFIYNESRNSNDIDIYLVFDRITNSKYCQLLEAAHDTKLCLEDFTDKPWEIETRRGPFKILDHSTGQLHLLIEDLESIKKISAVNALNWINNGKTIFGKNIRDIIDYDATIKLGLSSSVNELSLLIKSIQDEYIEYKEWTFSPQKTMTYKVLQNPSKSNLEGLRLFAIKTGLIIYKTAINPNYKIESDIGFDQRLNRYIQKSSYRKTDTINFLKKLLSNLQTHDKSKARTSEVLAR